MTTFIGFNEAEGLDTSNNLTTNASTAVASVARGGFRFNSIPAAGSDTETATWDTPIQEAWIHLLIAPRFDVFANTANAFEVQDTAGAVIVALEETNTGGILKFVAPSGVKTTIATGTTVREIDIHLKLSATSGFARVYLAGSLLYEESGDTIITSGIDLFDTLLFRDKGRAGGISNSDSTCTGWGQVIVSSLSTIGAQLFTLTHTAGSINDWDTGAITDVDEAGVDDVDKATTTTNNDEFTMDTSDTLSTPTVPNKYTSVIQTFRASYDSGSAVTKLTPFVNDTTATSTTYGSAQTLTTGFANYRAIYDSDPVDSADWTATRINNYEFGVRANT